MPREVAPVCEVAESYCVSFPPRPGMRDSSEASPRGLRLEERAEQRGPPTLEVAFPLESAL
jgi:hypothetical protein